jgi:hypothetical protein
MRGLYDARDLTYRKTDRSQRELSVKYYSKKRTYVRVYVLQELWLIARPLEMAHSLRYSVTYCRSA